MPSSVYSVVDISVLYFGQLMCVFNTWAEVAKYKVDFSRRIPHSFNRAVVLLCYFMLSISTQRFNVKKMSRNFDVS